jgi:hypothetical protein
MRRVRPAKTRWYEDEAEFAEAKVSFSFWEERGNYPVTVFTAPVGF